MNFWLITPFSVLILIRYIPLLLGFWKKISGSLLLVECEIPVELSAERLTKRNTTGGEFDRLRGIDLTNAMTSHVQLLKMVIASTS